MNFWLFDQADGVLRARNQPSGRCGVRLPSRRETLHRDAIEDIAVVIQAYLYRTVTTVDQGVFIHITHRSEEHTSELQSLMRISYAVFCLKKKNKNNHQQDTISPQQNKHYPSQLTIHKQSD